MGEYHRTTRACSLDSMRPELAVAIRDRIEIYNPNDIEASAMFFCDTISTKQKKRLFGRTTEVIQTGIILTPRWLIWATGKENESPGVLVAKLSDLQVQEYEKSDMNRLIQDAGISISGLHTGTADLGSAFIPLDSEPVAQ